MQQKVLGIIPSSTPGGAQTYTTFQPRTATLNIRPNTPGSPQQVAPHPGLRWLFSCHVTHSTIIQCCVSLTLKSSLAL